MTTDDFDTEATMLITDARVTLDALAILIDGYTAIDAQCPALIEAARPSSDGTETVAFRARCDCYRGHGGLHRVLRGTLWVWNDDHDAPAELAVVSQRPSPP